MMASRFFGTNFGMTSRLVKQATTLTASTRATVLVDLNINQSKECTCSTIHMWHALVVRCAFKKEARKQSCEYVTPQNQSPQAQHSCTASRFNGVCIAIHDETAYLARSYQVRIQY